MTPGPGQAESELPTVRVRFDGACESTPVGRVATYGFTAEGPDIGVEEYGLAVRPDSERATNNVAEYTGAVRALERLAEDGFRGRVIVEGDSELVVRQMNGEYRVRADHLMAYHERLRQLCERFPQVLFRWIPREENQRADELTKRAVREVIRTRSGGETKGSRAPSRQRVQPP